jgi:hypothetical protein
MIMQNLWACIGLENRDYGRRDPPRWLCDIPLSAQVGTNFADKRRSLSRYNSLPDSGHGVFFMNMYNKDKL